jgi:GH15 family glucan-1,4-alpha-glucosidase
LNTLDLALIGNGAIGSLVDERGTMVWTCVPRFDGDPVFCSLLQGDASPDADGAGFFSIDLVDQVRAEQEYLVNTPILVTRLHDSTGGCVEITDFAPRFQQHGRLFCPMMLARRVKRTAGSPRVRVRLRPSHDYGRHRSGTTTGSSHVRYVGGGLVLRLTTDASITAVVEERAFFLADEITLLIGPDETVQGGTAEVGRRFFEETADYWRDWVRALAIPYEWQDAVIRAAITLELSAYHDTGAVVAAMTTSIPEAAYTERTWDYRYCWLRDASFVVNALNQLGATRTMERLLGYILNVVADADDGRLQPLYDLSGRPVQDERVIDSLAGYRGMGPVRVGNQAHVQAQHDVYGAAILAATHVFFDRRLVQRGDDALFHRLEALGEQAARLFDQPDAGPWELRGKPHVHTFSSMMCWAACDRLARIATHLGLVDRAACWQGRAQQIHDKVCARSWNAELDSFVATMGGKTLDAGLLRLADVGFLAADDPRFASTVRAIERDLRKGDFVFRYVERDDFGTPDNAFLVCTCWYINALAAIGRRGEARELFEKVLACRNRHGLLSEHIDPRTHEQWGNFVQTYSMVGVIDCAIRLSVSWDEVF